MSRRLSRPRRLRRSAAAPPEEGRRTPPTPIQGDRPWNHPSASRGRTKLLAHGPADLLALIPFQLGFHPAESAVTVFLHAGKVKMTARVDLPPPAAAAEFARQLRGLVRQHDIDELVLFAYSAQPGPARALLTGLVRALPARLVCDALYVDGARWWSVTCDQACCPAEGTPYDVASSRLAAEAVYSGLTARATRDELVATVHGPPDEEVPRLVDLAAEVRNQLKQLAGQGREAERLERAVCSAVADPTGLDDRTCSALALLVTDLRFRDLALALIGPDEAEEHVEVWLRVVNRVPPELSAAPLALLGMAGWINGHGALLNCCVDRLLDLHPGYSMGRLLAEISGGAVSPSVWRSMGEQIRADVLRGLEGLAG
jgi:hypothetical protein